MANPLKGEVGFDVGGKEYVFKLGTYAQVLLERRTKQPANKFFARKPDEWGVDDMLSVFYAGLNRQHKLTEEQVADLMDELGPERIAAILQEAVDLAKPKESGNAAAPPVPAHPPMAEANATGTVN